MFRYLRVIVLAAFISQFEGKAAKAVKCLENGFDDATAVFALPEKYRKRLRTTNMQERLNEEVRRRERVIRIFPNEQSAKRLVGALLAETNENWSERLYLGFHAGTAENSVVPVRGWPSSWELSSKNGVGH